MEATDRGKGVRTNGHVRAYYMLRRRKADGQSRIGTPKYPIELEGHPRRSCGLELRQWSTAHRVNRAIGVTTRKLVEPVRCCRRVVIEEGEDVATGDHRGAIAGDTCSESSTRAMGLGMRG